MAQEQRSDPIPPLKRQLGAFIADIIHAWNGDDMGVILGVDRFRVADLRRQKLDRFSLETLIRMVERLGYTVTISTERRRFGFRSTRGLTRNRGD